MTTDAAFKSQIVHLTVIVPLRGRFNSVIVSLRGRCSSVAVLHPRSSAAVLQPFGSSTRPISVDNRYHPDARTVDVS